MTAIERVKEALHLLELVDEELSEHEGEYDFAWSIIQDAVYCQKIINSIVWRCNKVNNPGLEKPKEPSGDLISRADAIDAFTEDGTWLERQCVTSLTMVEAKQRAVDILSTLPSAKGGDAEMNEVKPQYMQSSPNNGADLISRADAIEAVVCHIWHMPNEVYRQFNCENIVREVVEDAIKRLPSAEAVSREEYEETDGVINIKKQSAKDVGEIKHIVVCSPNYTRYFYNDSMPTQYKGGEDE